MEANKLSRRDELEAHFRKYPDVPREVIVKEDVLRNGVDFTEAALELGEGHHTKTYHLFTTDQAPHDKDYQARARRIPESIEIWGGPYDLRQFTTIRSRMTPGSAYLVDAVDGKMTLCERAGDANVPLALIRDYPPTPNYYAKSFEDGTPYRNVVQLVHGNRGEPRIVAMLVCQHWGPRNECRFCDINHNVRLRKQRGDLKMSRLYQDPKQAAEVMKEVVFGEDWGVARPNFFLLTGGTVIKRFHGFDEEEFYSQYVTAVNESLGDAWRMDCDLQTHPKPKEVCRRWYEAGVRFHEPNYEVWDERLFGIVCPGKAKVIGRENWIKLTLEEVEVFGVGNVIPGFVAGIEMARPWGFATVDEAIKSNLEAFEFLMSHGVIPRPLSCCVESQSAVGGQPQLPLDYYIRLDVAWYETWKKYRLPQDMGGRGMRAFGTGRNIYPNNASRDMGT